MELLLTAVVGYLSNVTNEHVMLINVGFSKWENIEAYNTCSCRIEENYKNSDEFNLFYLTRMHLCPCDHKI